MGERETAISRSMARAKQVDWLIDQGRPKATVVMSLPDAALKFGLSIGRFSQLGERGQELGISVQADQVMVELTAAPSAGDYEALWGLVYFGSSAREKVFLANEQRFRILSRMLPDWQLRLEGLRTGEVSLTEDELDLLAMKLSACYFKAKNKGELPYWNAARQTAAGR